MKGKNNTMKIFYIVQTSYSPGTAKEKGIETAVKNETFS
jgi:hypothetical protein